MTPAYRLSDPDTSRAAAERHPVKRNGDRHVALVILSRHPGGLTDFELAKFLGRQQTSAGKRRGELRDNGYVIDTQVRRPAPSGSNAIVWAITAKGREALAHLQNVSRERSAA